jgi:hypothetical protein
MLITFKSKGAPNILMYEKDAKRMLDLLGKDTKRGVITKDEAASAIEKLQTEIATTARAEQEAGMANTNERAGEFGDDHEHAQAQSVSFATRAYPFLEMLRAAQRNGYDVLWGV